MLACEAMFLCEGAVHQARRNLKSNLMHYRTRSTRSSRSGAANCATASTANRILAAMTPSGRTKKRRKKTLLRPPRKVSLRMLRKKRKMLQKRKKRRTSCAPISRYSCARRRRHSGGNAIKQFSTTDATVETSEHLHNTCLCVLVAQCALLL